jgi:outer membrane protein assembly factor BamB
MPDEDKGSPKGDDGGAAKPGFLRSLTTYARHPVRLWREKRWIAVAILLVVALAIAGGIVAYEVLKRPPDVHNEEAIREFVPEKPKEAPAPKEGRPKTVNWPMYGLDPARTRYLPARGIRPPFRKLWRFTQRPLLEFPPILAGRTLYAVNNSGFAFAINAETGKKVWERRIGTLNASSPVYYKHRLYIVNLVPGHIVKLNAANGRIIWKKSLPGRAESSPVVVGNSVYFGCENGELFSVSTVNGHTRWSTPLGGPVKSAPAYYGGHLYVGDYGGYMNSVDAKTGELIWQTGSLGTGIGGGEFYSTPAVAFGRVYAGNNDDRVYSFDIKSGELAWTYSTGGYAYSGPTVASTKHSPPTVYIGSFDGNVYALNAKDGSVRWSRGAGGQVVGSLSAVGEIVYVAEFTNKTTTGFMMHSGRRVFTYPKGTYTPIISDGRRLYLTGYSSITALEPVRLFNRERRRKARLAAAFAAAHPRAARARAKRRRAAAAAGAAPPARRTGSARSGGQPSAPRGSTGSSGSGR